MEMTFSGRLTGIDIVEVTDSSSVSPISKKPWKLMISKAFFVSQPNSPNVVLGASGQTWTQLPTFEIPDSAGVQIVSLHQSLTVAVKDDDTGKDDTGKDARHCFRRRFTRGSRLERPWLAGPRTDPIRPDRPLALHAF